MVIQEPISIFFLTSWRCRWSVGRPAWWFSIGLNNKDQDPEKASVKQVRRALSKSLTKTQRRNLTTMNNFICTHFNYLTCIPQQYFHTTVDGLNWTEETVARACRGSGLRGSIEPCLERESWEKNSTPQPDLSWCFSSNILNLSKVFTPSGAQSTLMWVGETGARSRLRLQ